MEDEVELHDLYMLVCYRLKFKILWNCRCLDSGRSYYLEVLNDFFVWRFFRRQWMLLKKEYIEVMRLQGCKYRYNAGSWIAIPVLLNINFKSRICYLFLWLLVHYGHASWRSSPWEWYKNSESMEKVPLKEGRGNFHFVYPTSSLVGKGIGTTLP
jgi:hypothetical protein